MFLKKVFLLLLPFLVFFSAKGQLSEKQYSELVQRELGGQLEAPVPSGRVDVLTDYFAIEVEFARKWKNSIGQSLWYALNTSRKAGIVLILENESDWKYVQQLTTTLDYSNLKSKVKVWIYPNDFKKRVPKSYGPTPKRIPSEYWLTKATKIRHNKDCRYFKKTRGDYCSPNKGTPCKTCGG